MGIPVDMNGVDAWTPGNVLSPGQHTVKVTEAKEEPASTGTPQIILSMEATAGPEVGGTITDWIAVTPNTLGRVRMIMEAFQIPVPAGQFVLEASAFVNRTARIIVRSEPGRKDPSKSFSKVGGYEPSGNGTTGGMGGTPSGDPLDQVASSPNGFSQPAAVGGGDFGPPRTDDDIPF